MDERPQWSSERAFIISTSAAAVGLGNLWRFPYMAGEHGGAAFILAYLIAIVTLGLPLMILEISAGRLAQGSPVTLFRYVHRRAATVGWLVVVLTTIIMSYYLVITGWTLGYTAASLSGNLVPFSEFTQGYASLWYFFAVSALTGWILLKGLAGIEQKTKILMPILVLVVLGLAALGISMEGGRRQAAAFLLNPDFNALLDPTIWLFAFGQAFYSLAVGQGYLITYGSYLPPGISVQRSAMAVAGVETTIALLAGWMIFPMVFAMGFAPDAGSELAFNTLPAVFETITGGPVLAVVFFALFFAAALSSCIAGMQVVVSAFREEFRLTRPRAVYISMALIVAMGIPSALSFTPVNLSLGGRPFLEVMDMFAATQVVVASAMIGGTLISWLIPRETLVAKLGTRWKWEARLLVTVGRYLFVPVILVLVYTALR